MAATGEKDKSAELVIYEDDVGGERVALRAHGGDAFLAFRAAKGKAAQTLSLGADEAGSMNLLLEENGRKKIVLGGGPKGDVAVKVQSKEGKTLLEVPNP